LLPLSSMTLEQQINAITRSVIIIFVIIMLFDVKCAIVFLVVSVIFIILLYYLQRNKMTTNEEPFENKPDPEDNSRNPKYQVPPKPKVNYYYDYDNQPEKTMFCDDKVSQQFKTTSFNQRLAGKANPKTLIPPVITMPSHDDNWRATNLTTNNISNRESVKDLFASGYISMPEITDPDQIAENSKEGYSIGRSRRQGNLNTQTIQPGVYYNPEEIEPISKNMGITETQRQRVPIKEVDNGDIYYNEYNTDARFKKIEVQNSPGPEDIYDPRFTGYGTSYRSYYDEFVGQPRFYYDDVNAMRMPNYVIRSKVDHLDFSDHYGPMDDNYGVNNDEMREMVNQSFLDNSLSFIRLNLFKYLPEQITLRNGDKY
ncbi:MAG: hypothetical protein EB127_30695, partial [Alphaproteobacteria bacterium]|nr:hypothetical protein [Alphaproteobacteria bacterium]